MGEFELIDYYFKRAPCASPHPNIALGIGDDCALLLPSDSSELAISTDTLVADIHFPAQADSFLIGQRALAVAVSDLAAMGAKPLAFTLALTLPKVDEAWLKGFAEGLSIKAQQCAIALVGGDTTKGNLTITITVIGEVPKGKALLRSTAQVGDLLCVSGSLGNGAAALPMVLGQRPVEQQVLAYYWSPTPQLALGQFLCGKASSCIDISDGLLADCEHIAKASRVAIVIELAKLPINDLVKVHYDQSTYQAFALAGGDDYQLAFTIAEHYLPDLMKLYSTITIIGRVVEGETAVTLLDANCQPVHSNVSGYKHF